MVASVIASCHDVSVAVFFKELVINSKTLSIINSVESTHPNSKLLSIFFVMCWSDRLFKQGETAMNTKTQVKIIKKIFAEGGKALIKAGKAIECEKDPAMEFTMMEKCLRGLDQRIKDIDEMGSGILLEAIGDGCGLIGNALDSISDTAVGPCTELKMQHLLSGLEVTADAVLAAANSVNPPGNLNDEDKKRSKKILSRFPVLQLEAAAVGYDFHNAASILRDLAGIPQRADYQFPSGGCGCSETQSTTTNVVNGNPSMVELNPSLAFPNCEAKMVVESMPNLSASLASIMITVGGFISEFPVAFLFACCPNLCTTPGSSSGCTLGTIAATNNGTSWVPTFTLNWVMCCSTGCCLMLSRNTNVTRTTIHTVGGIGAIPNTRPVGAANTAARGTATASATAANNALIATPPVAVPAQAPAIMRKTAIPGLALPAC
jgi:hypothetical protein